jgi:outer membrane protein assembly factor BamA
VIGVRAQRWAGKLWIAAVVAGLAGHVAACGHRREARAVSGAEYRVRKVLIEGNTLLSDEKIEKHLNLRETTWFPLPQRRYLFEGYLPVDADRIEKLYAAHGHYDAEVVDVRVDRNGDRKTAVVTFVVDEGPATRVGSIEFAWPEGPPSGRRDRRATPAKIQTHCDLTVGGPFSVEEMHASEATMREALRARGYAFSRVEARAEVDRTARRATVHYELVPGPFVRIGQADLRGLRTIPEEPVRVEIEGYLGKPFSPRRLQNMEDAIYGLGVFTSVSIQPAKRPRDGKIDLTIEVRESKPQHVGFGVGLGFESNRWEQYGAARYTHDNLFGNLTRLNLQLKAGYAEVPALYRPEEHGPLLKVEPSLRKKGLLEKKLVWTLAPAFEVGIQEGYQYYAPSNRVGVGRFFTRYVETNVSHNLRFVDFFSVSPVLDGNRSLLGLDFRDPYLLSYVEVELNLHFTDRLLDPHHGAVLGTTYDIAGGIFGGQYDYQAVTPSLRAYWTPIRRRLQFAARAQTGFIFPYGDEPGAPFDLKLYLGGAATMRGWGVRRLSPYVTWCTETTCDTIPVGGNTSVLGNFETRVRVWKKLWMVGFFDAGDVQPKVATFRPQEWNYSTGPGVRYHSRIGTFRLDVGVRLNDPPRFAHQPRWAVHLGLGEAF